MNNSKHDLCSSFHYCFFCCTCCPWTEHRLLRCTSSQAQVSHLSTEQCKRLKELQRGVELSLLITSGDNTGSGFWVMEISELLSSYCLSKGLCDKMLRHPFPFFPSQMLQADNGLKSAQISSIHPPLSPCCPAPRVYQWGKATGSMILKPL